MSKYKGKYRSESHRLKDWDYSTPGFYYVTITTKNRQHFFGQIRSGIMGLSSVGQLVVEKIRYISIRHPHARIDEFVVMPDHIHLIVHLQIMDENTNTRGRYAPRGNPPWDYAVCRYAPRGVSTWDISTRIVSTVVSSIEFHAPIRAVNSDKTTQNPNHHWQWKSGCLGSVINQFKGDVKKTMKSIDPLFDWHLNFNDSIIWDFQSYLRIKGYIQNNPKKWNENQKY